MGSRDALWCRGRGGGGGGDGVGTYVHCARTGVGKRLNPKCRVSDSDHGILCTQIR